MIRRMMCLMVCVSIASTGCLDVGQSRAAHDLTIGQAKTADIDIVVENGLAAVRTFEVGKVSLWGQAPSLRWTLRTGATTQNWSIEVKNSLSSAKLAFAKEGQPLQSIDRTASPLPTVGQWTIELEANSTYTMQLQADGADVEGPFRFIVYADVQGDIDRVQDIYQTMSKDPTVAFGLISGDLTADGSKPQIERFQKEMETLPFPCFATLGNHELGTSETLFHDYFGRGNYSFVYKGVRFTLLDSASANIAPMVYPWLDNWLEQGKQQLHMVMMHIPPLDVDGRRHGAFASRAEAHQLLSKLAKGNVDLTIYGHVHTYAAYSNAGIPAFISGGGGAFPMRLDGIGRHFMSIDATPEAFVPSVIRVYPAD